MAESIVSPGDRELDRALSDLARHVTYPPTPDIASGVRRRLANQPARPRPFAGLWSEIQRIWDTLLPLQRRLAVAALVLVAVAGTIVAVSPEARTAIAERLGLRGVQIQQVPSIPTQTVPSAVVISSPAGLPSPAAASPGSRLNLGQPMTLEQVRARVGYPVRVPGALGAPDEVYLLDVPAGGQVALIYYARPDLPQANGTGVGLLLTEFQGNVTSTGAIGKGLPPGTRLEAVQVNTGPGYWIDGDPHAFFYLDARGQVRTETTRLAGSVLLWEQGELTLRLEAALSKDAALQIAASAQ
jgi:hypothetical protein